MFQGDLSVPIFGFQIFQDIRVVLFPEPEKGIIPGMAGLSDFMRFLGCLWRICVGNTRVGIKSEPVTTERLKDIR